MLMCCPVHLIEEHLDDYKEETLVALLLLLTSF